MKNPAIQLRLEAFVVLLVCLHMYGQNFGDWKTFALLFFIPDLAALLYFVNSRVGGWAYNIAHFYGFPLSLFFYGWLTQTVDVIGFAVIWAAHISFDRVMGWGLKYEDSFYHTHLGTRKFPWQK